MSEQNKLTIFGVCLDTQATFNQDWENRYITFAGWNDSASSIGVIAYKLLSQNDSSDKIDRSKVSIVRNFPCGRNQNI